MDKSNLLGFDVSSTLSEDISAEFGGATFVFRDGDGDITGGAGEHRGVAIPQGKSSQQIDAYVDRDVGAKFAKTISDIDTVDVFFQFGSVELGFPATEQDNE